MVAYQSFSGYLVKGSNTIPFHSDRMCLCVEREGKDEFMLILNQFNIRLAIAGII